MKAVQVSVTEISGLIYSVFPSTNMYIKGTVHPKLKITPWFTHPQAILGVYDFPFSNKYNQCYIKNMFCLFQAL